MTDRETGLSLVAVGDIMMGRGLAPVVDRYGADHLFRPVADLLAGADLTFGNLEAPLTEGGARNLRAKPAYGQFLRADPRCAGALKAAGFNVLSLANTHINDFGGEGIRRTRQVLTERGIAFTGAGHGHAQAREPVRLRAAGLTVGVLAYSDHSVRPSSEWGVAPLREPEMKADIRRLRAEGCRVVVSIHTGIDFSDYPYPFTIRLARALVDAGADLVLGHHPHILQGWERYRSGTILYSLGNFVFDEADPATAAADYARSPYVKRFGLVYEPSDTRPVDSVVFRCRLTEDGVRDETFAPVRINAEGQPVPQRGEVGAAILRHLDEISGHFDDAGFPEWEKLERLFLDLSVGRVLRRPGRLAGRLHRIRLRHVKQLWRWLARRSGGAGS